MEIVLILQLIAIVFIIMAIVSDKIATKRTKEIFAYYEKKLEEQYDENQDLKHLRLQDESNIVTLEKKNKELQNFKDETTDIAYGKRTNDEKVDKIIEVIQSANKNNF